MAGTPIARIRITLEDVEPPVWRRVEVPADISLADLHEVVQVAMGWTASHLYAFVMGETAYGEADPELDDGIESQEGIRLSDIAAGGERLHYEYDFGDGWLHTLEIEEIAEPEPGVRYPRCTAGERACPPEDCGGPMGYAALVDILADPEHSDHDEMQEWLGGPFDPMAFDLEGTDAALAQIPRTS